MRFHSGSLVLALFLLAGCGGDDKRIDDPSLIRGVVTDAGGAPVPNAKILFHYNGEPLDGSFGPDDYGNELTQETLTVSFALPLEDRAQLWVESWDRLTDVVTLVNEVLPAGQHSADWDRRSGVGGIVQNNGYWFLLRSADDIDSFAVFINVDNFQRGWEAYETAVYSDGSGTFGRTQHGLPFDGIFTRTIPSPSRRLGVSRALDVIAIREDGAVARTDSVVVDPLFGADVVIQFED